jgi:hypothetical protein
MLKNYMYLKNANSFKANMITSKTLLPQWRRFCSDLDKFDPTSIKSILPIKISEPLMPYSNSIRNFLKDDTYLSEFLKKLKDTDKNLTDQKVAAFLYDKKKNKLVAYGVECSVMHLETTGEVSIISQSGDKRVQLLYPEKCQFDGSPTEVREIKDKPDTNRLIEHELAKNLISDINKVIFSCLELSSRPVSAMENSLMRDLNGALVYLQALLQNNMDFIVNTNPSQFSLNYPEGVNKMNSLVYKNIQEFLKIAKKH